MKKQKLIFLLVIITAFTTALFLPGVTFAGGPKWKVKRFPAPVEKTGQDQLISWRTHDDGDLQKGVAWPSPRFTDNNDGTITDNLTGLIWLKNADCGGGMIWADAVDYGAALYDGCTDCGGVEGDCGLSDGSSAGDWRLPNVKELLSLIDYGHVSPALPTGHPFDNVISEDNYWSSTVRIEAVLAFYVYVYNGIVLSESPAYWNRVWPVRSSGD